MYELELHLYLFAKELGQNYEFVLDMPYKFFRMCAIELGEEGKANKAASDGKKYQRNPQHDILKNDDKERYSTLIEERKEQLREASGDK